jgi:integrase
MPGKKAGRRNPHQGVTLIAPSGEHKAWRAKWRDPDDGRQIAAKLDALAVPTAEARRGWAIAKAKQIAKRKLDIEHGADPVQGSDLEDAVKDFHKSAANRLRESTLALYKLATDEFVSWAHSRGIRSTRDLKAPRLHNFHDYLLAQRKSDYVRGGSRGQRKAGTGRLSAATINWRLRAVKALLNKLREAGKVPLTSDAITASLKATKGDQDAIVYLKQHECQQLLAAASRHDAATVRTREGLTLPRYEPIAPLVATVMLGGFRVSEALALRWEQVDLDVLDADRKPRGAITLKGEGTKTKKGRVVSLEVTPQLRALLAAMKERRGERAYVFGQAGDVPMPKPAAEAARRRLVGSTPPSKRKAEPLRKRKELPVGYGAPPSFSWQALRATTATFQCNAPAVFGSAAAFKSAKRLGHSIAVSERFYADELSVSRTATTLEQAMGVEDLMAQVIADASAGAREASNVVRLADRVG